MVAFAQLPPVMDKALWKKGDIDAIDTKIQSSFLYSLFTRAVTLNEICRQDLKTSKEFVELLQRARNGE